jgi:cytochrome c oxidase cbb3-type subunit 2
MWEKNPILLLLLATGAILVGTIITMVLPFAWVNTEADRIDSVVPYTALQQEGRDIYIREGCNNCHTQTVRPLVSDVLRYGDYSKSGEFVYDRPFLWGSKRTGPDLARLGGKYPDAWHYKHMKSPRIMFPRTNMPDYGWLAENKLDPQMTRRKMDVLGFPYTDNEIKGLAEKTEMDAIVAYLQKLGSDIPWREAAASEVVGDLTNPTPADPDSIEAGRLQYIENCRACHGTMLEGDIARGLTDLDVTDKILFMLINDGIEEEMPAFSNLGAKRIWQIVNYINYGFLKKAVQPQEPEKSMELKNPAPGDASAIKNGRQQYVNNCQACHGPELEGDIGPELTELDYEDNDLYMLLSDGIEGEMPGFAKIGATKLWQIVNYLNYGVKE